MRNFTYRKFSCKYRNGRLITLEICERCRKSHKCDVYATVLDDDEGDDE